MCKSMFVAASAFAVAVAFATPALADVFPVTGTITINGSASNLPSGTFANATYDPATGALSTGKFAFPQSTTTINVGGFGDITVVYQFSQTNTSTALVAGDGTAAMTQVAAKIEIISTSLPLTVTPCRFGPIPLDLAGTGAATGLDLEDRSFTVPPTTDSCGNFRDVINSQLAGSDNSIAVHLAGDFTPPPGDDNDTIFVDGFDG